MSTWLNLWAVTDCNASGSRGLSHPRRPHPPPFSGA